MNNLLQTIINMQLRFNSLKNDSEKFTLTIYYNSNLIT